MNTILLAIDNNNAHHEKHRAEWIKYGIDVIQTTNMQDAIRLLDPLIVSIVGINADNILYSPLFEVLRSKTNAPIHVLTSNYDFEEDTIIRTRGADHYGEWRSPSDSTARGITMLKRYSQRNHEIYPKYKCIFENGILLIPAYRKVFVNDDEVELTRKEFDLLSLLMSEPKRVFTYEIIYHKVWGFECFVDKGALWNNVKRLRKKLNLDVKSKYLKNVHDYGYAFYH